MNIDDGCLDGEIREGCDFPPGLGHRMEDHGMSEIQFIPNAVLS
jgi:hypothetical protein